MRWIQTTARSREGYISVPKSFWEKMRNCLKRKPRFITFPFGFNCAEGSRHANYMIYDTKQRSLERFDPRGKYTSGDCYDGDVDFEILDLFRKNMGEKFVTVYYPPNSFVNETCWQFFEYLDKLKLGNVTTGGFCSSWSAFYADARMSNPDLDRNHLGREIYRVLRTDPMALPAFIRSYTAFLEKVQREYDRTGSMATTFANVASKCIGNK